MLQIQATKDARLRLAEQIIETKHENSVSFQDLADEAKLSLVFTTAALLGQHPLPADAAQAVGKRLDLTDKDVRLLQTIPVRGSLSDDLLTDPTIYRFNEIVQVYGTTLKALVHELFGDGIISAINFRLDIKRVEDPQGGARAVITLDGKFLPTQPY
ncbi:cyanase [Acidipila sp. EB88]|uniref:cyanase n=1 Tax=Acidipila sp. EB88 TaxID=2305226 RepID=UPI000F5F255F|nr:cyanase [Acidipila sp. EB88]RRA47673.1 cyanase [Acidipila sp. EB88]